MSRKENTDWLYAAAAAAAAASQSLLLTCRLAAKLGGGNLVAPAQRVNNFLAEEVSRSTLPTSSYRFVRGCECACMAVCCVCTVHAAPCVCL